MRLSIDVGYNPETVRTVSEYLRQLEVILATDIEHNVVAMPCRDDSGNSGMSLIFVKKEQETETDSENVDKEESTETSEQETDTNEVSE